MLHLVTPLEDLIPAVLIQFREEASLWTKRKKEIIEALRAFIIFQCLMQQGLEMHEVREKSNKSRTE